MSRINKKTLSETLGLLFKEVRKEKGYNSYESFAIENDLDRKQYWRIENGSNFTIKSLEKIMQIHGLTIEDLSDIYKKHIQKLK